MTQSDLADALGVSLRTVGNWERGETVPRNRMAPLAEVLRLTDAPEFGEEALLRRLGSLAKRRREEIGLGRAAFAKEAGLGSDATIRDFEFGRHLPSSRTRMLLEKALQWRLGSIEDAMRQVNRKAASIEMEELDAEDSLYAAAQQVPKLGLVSNEDLISELSRRLGVVLMPVQNTDAQNLYGLAASTNNEHLEDED